MIKNVIFDLGDVLININPFEYIKKLGYSDEKAEASTGMHKDKKENYKRI